MVTMNDVAKQAGVSKSTVSNVFSKKRPISKEVSEHVLQVARQLNYKPNYFARSLTTRETRIIGLNMRGDKAKFSQFHLSLINGVLRQCYERGYRLLINTLAEKYANRVEFQSSDPVDGEILLDPIEKDPRIEECLEKNLPMVVIGRTAREYSAKVATVDNDNVEASARVTEHLVRLGHRHILLLNAAKKRTVSIDREAGFKKIMLTTYPDVDHHFICYKAGEETAIDYGYERTLDMLRNNPDISAVIADTDKVALGVYKAAAELGRVIPDDLSVMAFSDEPVFLSEFSPALSSMKLNSELLGIEAANTLIDQIEADSPSVKRTTIATDLILRASTAKK
ncbi:LacI family transcriptional regulator [Alkalihalobacillus oceani]|uniref:LacI family DNA-binding transcriptional regulator n=1 Tax=Halalkalibacter oceani TaxID=1653776 RepID=UPI00203A8CB4|nr:LacI family DNA-binding transcriptional regulator [Halalkalibacter oceani]MCM3760555.1 LacI family transcriptional regulator [Halalkalibacter oceani]